MYLCASLHVVDHHHVLFLIIFRRKPTIQSSRTNCCSRKHCQQQKRSRQTITRWYFDYYHQPIKCDVITGFRKFNCSLCNTSRRHVSTKYVYAVTNETRIRGVRKSMEIRYYFCNHHSRTCNICMGFYSDGSRTDL